MLELLTQYLSRARRVTIPDIGSLRLETIPAHWDVVEQELRGPSFVVGVADGAEVATEQIEWLSSVYTVSDASAALSDFGGRLRQHLLREPFLWPGVGLLHWQDGQLHLQPATPVVLAPQPAARVLRDDARHSIRVGEEERWSDDVREDDTTTRRFELEWIGWVALALALLFIVWCFYNEGFSIHATGLR